MDRNTIIGIALIFILFYVWAKMNAPSEEQLAEIERVQDSIALAEQQAAETIDLTDTKTLSDPAISNKPIIRTDSVSDLILSRDYGAFAPAASGKNDTISLENELIKVDFSTKGGRIVSATLKEYWKLIEDEERNDVKIPLILMEDDKNIFEYLLPVPGAAGGFVKTSDLYFTPKVSSNSIVFRAEVEPGKYIEQVYNINSNAYDLTYDLHLVGMDKVLKPGESTIQLNWINYLDRLEKNTQYEKIYSTTYYKEGDDDPGRCSIRKDDTETLEGGAPIRWISNANQFFNSTLVVRDGGFDAAVLEASMLPDDSDDLKKLSSQIKIPFSGRSDETFQMQWILGPNDFDLLRSYQSDLEFIIPFGSSVFGSINRWVIRPIFTFLSRYIGSAGIVILLLTLIVKSVVYPLTYKMLHSQSKMGALKPEMAKLREKYKDDQQTMQMETMKIYREYGVNPAGGCFPMILQMPIWFALYRFFPAAIEFRQASFLWANDLSSYDVFFRTGVEIPFLGDHVSLFTLLWAVSILVYTYYNSKIMDMATINPMMKYMQYLMPLMFIFFFNSYASGLTCYLLFSNLMNIAQTLITKNYLINNDKILKELEANRKKPKKKGGFQARLQKALAEQQKIAEQKTKPGQKGNKK